MAKVGRRPDILNNCEESIKEKGVMQAGGKSKSYGASSLESESTNEPRGEGWIQLSERIHMCNLQALKKGANVYKGKQKLDGGWRDIAVKLLPHSATDIKEINLHWKLECHPNIIQIVDAGESRGIIPHIYIAMELCSQTLKDFIDERKQYPFNFWQHFDFARQIVCGVASIHKQNILHRDIKLENILLSSTKENVRVADFGLSTQLKEGYSDITASARGLGSDGYRAPELLYEKPTTSFRSDSFSIGIVLAMLFSKGDHPFGPDPARWRTNISDNKGRDLSIIVTFPEPYAHKREQLVDLIEICLQRKASRRPTPQEMLEHEFFTDDAVMKQEVEDEPRLFDKETAHVPTQFTGDSSSEHKNDSTSVPEFTKAHTSDLSFTTKDSANTEEDIRPSAETVNTEAMDLSNSVTQRNESTQGSITFEAADLSTEVKNSDVTEGPQSSGERVKMGAAGPATNVKTSNDTKEPQPTAQSNKSEAPAPSSGPKSVDTEEGPLDQFLKAKQENIKRLENELTRSLREGGFQRYSEVLKELTNLRNSDDLDVAVQLAEYELMSKKNDLPIMKLRDLLTSSRSRSALDVGKMALCLKKQGKDVQGFILFKVSYDLQKVEANYAPENQLTWISDTVVGISSAITSMIDNAGWCSQIAKNYGVKYCDEMLNDLQAVNGARPAVKALQEIRILVSITGNTLRSGDNQKCIVYGEEGIAMMKQQFGEGVMFYKDYGGVLNNLGNAYDNVGQYFKAVQCYNEAIEAKSMAQDYDTEKEKEADVSSSVTNLENTNGKILKNPK